MTTISNHSDQWTPSEENFVVVFKEGIGSIFSLLPVHSLASLMQVSTRIHNLILNGGHHLRISWAQKCVAEISLYFLKAKEANNVGQLLDFILKGLVCVKHAHAAHVGEEIINPLLAEAEKVVQASAFGESALVFTTLLNGMILDAKKEVNS